MRVTARHDEPVNVRVETCEACRFDGAQYDLRDTVGTLRALGPMWRWAVEGVDPSVLATRPEADVWSALEYAVHCAEVADLHRLGLEVLLGGKDLVVDGGVELADPDTTAGMPAALDRLQDALLAEATLAADVPAADPRWSHTISTGAQQDDAAWLVRHTVHDVSHHLMDIGRGLHLRGAGAPTQEGRVQQLNVSNGGVPKKPVEVAEVGDRGLVGDRQAARQHHGRPLQALCLWSGDVVDALRAEGHPIEPGAAGENVTISGIDWSTIRPGTQLLIGDVLAEVSAWATPCKKNAAWFADGDFNRMSHDRHPGWSRAYAWVREPGTIRQGDPVVVEP
jgi:MOSC domain-containing protein YiiM